MCALLGLSPLDDFLNTPLVVLDLGDVGVSTLIVLDLWRCRSEYSDSAGPVAVPSEYSDRSKIRAMSPQEVF